ncbi:peroxiredoxin [Planctomicrobium piriforme]|uniref:thioredoxin-dependent peroxiredoxin n=1 Tax=Planctomicrobium piriforme TaxID=1576369 RepID=A0A1I3LXS6_9PLAN|nr:peroxiredoxin [Planctomicrobium piriforme]SFI89548.1 peroxiredoxin Q/BCP [Planctomicrobium piriforme]
MRAYTVLAVMGAMLLCAKGSEAMDELKVGSPAPKFAALDDTGAEWKSDDHVGKKVVVVYFYPADMTGGCTKQACKFRDDMSSLTELDIEVVGVSGDTVRNHQLFKQAYDLNYALLADTEGKVAQAFGVPFTAGEKSVTAKINGKDETLVRLGTSKRWTFVIDQKGKIAYINANVNPETDSHQVAEVVKDLKKGF